MSAHTEHNLQQAKALFIKLLREVCLTTLKT